MYLRNWLALPFGLALLGGHLQANVINSCNQTGFSGGSLISCTFNHNVSLQTGNLLIFESFTGISPTGVNVGLGLTNTFANNNIPGIFTYDVTKVITNNSGYTWHGFEVAAPNASALGPVTLVSGLSSCTVSGLGFTCGGGTVANGGTLLLQFKLSTPSDQGAGAFALFEEATVPEPATYGLCGLALLAAGVWRRRLH